MHILPYCGTKNLFDLEKIQPWIIKWMCVYLCADCRVCTVHNIKWKCCAQNREINIKKNNIAMMYKISKGYLNVVFSSIPICFALVELLCLICVNWEHFTSRSGIFQKMFGRSNFKYAQNARKVFKLLLNLEKWSLWIFKRKWNAVKRFTSTANIRPKRALIFGMKKITSAFVTDFRWPVNRLHPQWSDYIAEKNIISIYSWQV